MFARAKWKLEPETESGMEAQERAGQREQTRKLAFIDRVNE
jgi:hypothetical protein